MSKEEKAENISFFKSFIPQRISNDAVLSFFEFLRKLQFQKYPANFEKNVKNFENHLQEIEEDHGYIENQHNYDDMYYGNKTISYCGCEIIATYNAIYDLTGTHTITFPEMIKSFEENGIVLGGQFGTTPRSIEEYLNKQGFKTVSSTKINEYDKIGEISDALILVKYNDKYNIMNMVHTVNITKKGGKFFVHNNGKNCHLVGYGSITDLLEKIDDGKAKDIFLIGIFKNEK